eukprot:7092630-Pyramimonas_sp.AAC.1
MQCERECVMIAPILRQAFHERCMVTRPRISDDIRGVWHLPRLSHSSEPRGPSHHITRRLRTGAAQFLLVRAPPTCFSISSRRSRGGPSLH